MEGPKRYSVKKKEKKKKVAEHSEEHQEGSFSQLVCVALVGVGVGGLLF